MTINLRNVATRRHSGVVLALLTAVLLAGCRMDDAILDDKYSAGTPEERYPIRVAEAPVKMNVSARSGTLAADQLNSVIGFAQDARSNASSRIAVRWSSGSANSRSVAQQAIAVLIDQGVPESMISTGSYGGSGAVVTMSFMRKVAVTKECGDWSDNLTGDQYNKSYRNHGCATQQNIAAMVANPEDFETPRPMSPAPAGSRMPGIKKYYDGQP